MEIQGYVELRMTFSDDIATKTITIRYIIVNTSSVYNLVLGRPSLNKLDAMASMAHIKMKFPSSKEGLITINSDQKTEQKCYESSLKNRKGTYAITI